MIQQMICLPGVWVCICDLWYVSHLVNHGNISGESYRGEEYNQGEGPQDHHLQDEGGGCCYLALCSLISMPSFIRLEQIRV